MSTDPYAPPQNDSLAAQSPRAGFGMSEEQAEVISRQLKSLNNRSLAIGGLGLLLQVTGGLFPGLLGGLQRIVGTILLVIGLSFYARMRGHTPWLGLLGLLSCLGMVVLVLLPKRCFNCTAPVKGPQCTNCGAPAPQ